MHEYNTFTSSVDQHFCAIRAWLVSTIKPASTRSRPGNCGLRNSVDLGVRATADLVAFTSRDIQFVAQTTSFVAMANILRRTVVSGTKNLLVADKNGSNPAANTGAATGYNRRYQYEVAIPVRAFHRKYAPPTHVLKFIYLILPFFDGKLPMRLRFFFVLLIILIQFI